MADLINRKVINTTLSKDNAEKLRTLSKRKGIPQTRVLDRAVDTLYQKEEASMEGAAKHKGIAICIANNKGGVGKTTSTAAFADLLSKRGKHVLVIGARTHYYEGHGPRRVVHSVRTAAATGAKTMVLTNGAGGIKPSW